MKAKRKTITVSIEYSDRNEVKKAFNKIIHHLNQGRTRYEREKIESAICEFIIENVEPLEYEEKEINGQLCYVFQSSMNNEIKAKKNRYK